MAKYPNPMRVKASRAYDVLEAARALGRSPATIRNWIKDGLEVLASQKPYLILGQSIRDYIRSKAANRKCPLASDQLFCLSCRKGRLPHKMEVTVAIQNEKTLRLGGVCEACGCRCSRIISASKAHLFAETFAFKESVES